MAFSTLELKHTLRVIAKDRSKTLIVICTIALCIAINSTMFSVVKSFLFETLPYPEYNEIISVITSDKDIRQMGVSVPNYYDIKENSTSFESIGYHAPRQLIISRQGRDVESIQGRIVTPSIFTVLGVKPLLGRVFRDGEGERESENTVVISYRLWQSYFGGDPNVIGKMVTVNGEPRTVIGVMPKPFLISMPHYVAFLPIVDDSAERSNGNRDNHSYGLLARLKEDATVAQARSELEVIFQGIRARNPDLAKHWEDQQFSAHLDTYANIILNNPALNALKTTVYFLLFVGIAILFIGCLNIAVMSFGKLAARKTELAIRSSFGATRMSIFNQLLREDLFTFAVGGAIGLVLAHYAIEELKMIVGELPFGGDVRIDGLIIAITFLLVILSGVLVSALSIRSIDKDIFGAMRSSGRSNSSSKSSRAWDRRFVIFEIAVSVIFVSLTGLILNFSYSLSKRDLGFDRNDVFVTTYVAFEDSGANDLGKRIDRIINAIEAQSNRISVSFSNVVPIATSFQVTGYRYQGDRDQGFKAIKNYVVTPGFFDDLSIRVQSGRLLSKTDTSESEPVVVIDQKTASRYYGEGEALGSYIENDGVKYKVVGIVNNVNQSGSGLYSPEEHGSLYFSYLQKPLRNGYFTIKSNMDYNEVSDLVIKTIQNIYSDLPKVGVDTMEFHFERRTKQLSVTLIVLFSMSMLSLGLSGMGVFGVVNHSVRRRKKEIGIRLALGIPVERLRRSMILESATFGAVAILIGTALSVAISFVLRDVVYGIGSGMATVYIFTVLLFMVLIALTIWTTVVPHVKEEALMNLHEE